MLRSLIVFSLLFGFMLVPVTAKAVLRDNTVVLYMPFDEGKGEEVKDFSQSGKVGVLGSTAKNCPNGWMASLEKRWNLMVRLTL